MLPRFCIITISHCFGRLSKAYYLLLDVLKACQSVLIGKVRSLTFISITTTLLDVLGKNRYQYNTIDNLSLHILAMTIDFDYPERC